MFLLFEVSQSSILGYVPESLGLLIFGIGLILLAVGLRAVLRRSETNIQRELERVSRFDEKSQNRLPKAGGF